MKDKLDEARELAARKMIDILNYGSLNVAIAIGYRTGLFEVMDTFADPQMLSSIAEKAGLSPRYVREWLGIMATGGIVEVSQEKDDKSRFLLPKAYADILTRRTGNSNLGVYTQEIPLLTVCAMEAVIQGFHTGEGIHYEYYPRFQAFMSELANAKHRRVLIDEFLPSVNNGGVIQRLINGIRVCDLGCAEGTALLLMAEAFPESEFIGIDLSNKAIGEARSSAVHKGLRNTEFIVMDAATLKDTDRFHGIFDYVTAFDAVHDQTQPLDVLIGIHSILADGGIFSMVDIAAGSSLNDNLFHPMGPFLYTVSLMHCMPVGLVDGGAGLGMMWGREKAVDMLTQAGFQQIDVLEMPRDPFNLHFFCRK